jgi:serine protease Do
MRRSPSLLLCTASLIVGSLIGTFFETWPTAATVEANALGPKEADELYHQLSDEPNVLMEGSRLLSKVAQLTTPSVVHIQSERNQTGRGTVEETGSGVIVRSSRSTGTFVITNRHVIHNAELKDISIHLHDGRVIHPTQVRTDRDTDVAVLKVGGANLQPGRWGNSDELKIGHMVLAMGSPFGLSQSVTYGIISAKGRRSLRLGQQGGVLNQDFLQTDAAINPGNSGGPLIDLYGRIVGINTAIASNSGGNDGIGFSIPSNLVRRVAEQLLEKGRVQRAYLGVRLDPEFDERKARRLELDRLRGARVVEVYRDSPASRADLRLDDVILKFDDVVVLDENHLINLVSLTAVGTTIELTVMRNRKQQTIRIVLGDRSDLESRSEVDPDPTQSLLPEESMGLTLHHLERGLAGQIGLERPSRGLLVLNVSAGSPLKEQIELYDLIEEIARRPVSSLAEARSVLQSHDANDPILLKVRRIENGLAKSRLVVWKR